MSIWTRKGKCSPNSHSQLFTDPVRASVLPPRIHTNCLTNETFLIYDNGILCFHPAAQPEDQTNIFDGCSDEDSPWAAYLYGDEMDETNVFMSEAEEEAGMRNDLSTSLLEDHLHS